MVLQPAAAQAPAPALAQAATAAAPAPPQVAPAPPQAAPPPSAMQPPSAVPPPNLVNAVGSTNMDGMVQPEDISTIATKLAGGKTQQERKVPKMNGTTNVEDALAHRVLKF